MSFFALRRAGTNRLVLLASSFAIKFARHRKGRIANRFETALWDRSPHHRRQMLCPILWASPLGLILVMPRARELAASEVLLLSPVTASRQWDYLPPNDDEAPFELKTSDWGWLGERMVALDYSATADFGEMP